MNIIVSKFNFIYFIYLTHAYTCDMITIIKRVRGTWVAQLVKGLTLVQVMISRLMSSSPTSSSVLTAWSLEPTLDSVSPSLYPSPTHALSLSVPKKINKR